MTFTDDRFQKFEVPPLLLAIGQSIDDALRQHREDQQGTLMLRLELDATSAAALRRHYRSTKSHILEAARTHLLFRKRAGLEVRLEIFDSGTEMVSLFAVSCTMLQISGDATSLAGALSAGVQAEPQATAMRAVNGPRRPTA
jgi:hypothetical protein